MMDKHRGGVLKTIKINYKKILELTKSTVDIVDNNLMIFRRLKQTIHMTKL